MEKLNVNKIYVSNSRIALQNFIDKEEAGELDYEKNHFLKGSSLFIESIFLHLPFNKYIVHVLEDGAWKVKKGNKRIQILIDFFKDKFALEGLEFCPELNGKKFSDLEKTFQRYVTETFVDVIFIGKDTGTKELASILSRYASSF
jgi:hypothetical protein